MIRAYSCKDKPKVLELLQLNIPEFFDASEEKDLDHYLENEIEDYYVVVEDNRIIGSGGINYLTTEKIARISWDIINPNSQGKGIGKKLLQHRIDHLKGNQKVELIEVRTSQLVYQFYEKMGFTLENIEKNFWAKGFDLYQMKLKNKD
ncbi:GNAT family N-acetyltransferase [Marixanthomonas ophiurae]|uniref:GNAT family N-acetyltransferase n=1 Tax=Marixanthomonas ophiurae TaxID=387659 RepID=A0A3E1Q6A1_9FLAO|nr:GNAT family N-acetyltransferase [Marixanthomonas ophiurae]RFN57649.1 GNAT family N-acetyltransferase [Marixanthomonas ophiurae]